MTGRWSSDGTAQTVIHEGLFSGDLMAMPDFGSSSGRSTIAPRVTRRHAAKSRLWRMTAIGRALLKMRRCADRTVQRFQQ